MVSQQYALWISILVSSEPSIVRVPEDIILIRILDALT